LTKQVTSKNVLFGNGRFFGVLLFGNERFYANLLFGNGRFLK
jgi:hypothetical protein